MLNLCFGYTLQNDLNDLNGIQMTMIMIAKIIMWVFIVPLLMMTMTIWVCGEKSVKGHPSSTVDMAIQMAHHHPVTYFVSSHLEG